MSPPSDDEPTDANQAETLPTADGEAAFQPGDRLGRYMVLAPIGQGGMSVVYLAYDPELDRKVALKLLRLGLLNNEGRQRLLREAQAMARLSHPNVVPVYDVGAWRDQVFVAMEFVEGESLKKWMRTPRGWREVLPILIDAGRGLEAAHAAGLVHRDFKPDNVLIGHDGRVRVLDFGLARPVEELDGKSASERRPVARAKSNTEDSTARESVARDSAAGESVARDSAARDSAERETAARETAARETAARETVARETAAHIDRARQVPSPSVTRADQVVGTPAYMAPEQSAQGATDERADQFSFCVTLYEALYGQKPHDTTETGVGSAPRTVEDRRAPPRRAAAEPPSGSSVPRFIGRAVMRGLSLDPAHRWPSLGDLLAALARDPGTRRRRVIIAALALVALATVGIAVQRSQAEKRALCRGGAEKMAQVFGADTREKIRDAFARTGLPYADAAAQSFVTVMREYARAWTAMHQDACEATRLRGEQSEEVLDLRMACLDDRLKEASALTEIMLHPDQDTVQEASRAGRALTPIAACADVRGLKAPTPPPRSAADRARIGALGQRLAELEARYAVGKNGEAAKLGEALVKDATALGWGPLTAETYLWLGRAYADLGQEEKSIPAYKAAFAWAFGSRSDRILREAAARLAQEYIYKNDPGEWHYWDAIAQSAIERTGGDPHLESFLQHTRCVGLWRDGKVIERLDCLKKHAARVERSEPLTEWELTTLGLAASDAGRYEDAIQYLQRGVDYSTGHNGAAHPRTFEMRGYLCKGYLDYGLFDRALKDCSESLRAIKEIAPDNSYLRSRFELYLGSTLRELKRYGEARTHLEAARGGLKPEPGEALLELAQLANAEGDRQAALDYFARSLAEDEKALGPAHPNLVNDLLLLGEAQREHGDPAARATLERAWRICEHADLNPFMIADVKFAYARALVTADGARAAALAREARAAYDAAPKTARFDDERAGIDRWLDARPH